MAGIEELMPLDITKGCKLRLFIDHAKDIKDPDHNWTELSYDGEDPFMVPAHWHDNHDEIMEVLSGRAQFYIDGKKIIASAGDARLIIPRFSVHGIDFFKGEPTIIREKTVPAGEFKALFFQDVFRNGTPNFFMAMRAFYDGHSYAALPGNLKILDRLFVTVFGLISKPFVPAKLTALRRKGEEREGSD